MISGIDESGRVSDSEDMKEELPPANPLQIKSQIKPVQVRSCYAFDFYELPEQVNYAQTSEPNCVPDYGVAKYAEDSQGAQMTPYEYVLHNRNKIVYWKHENISVDSPTRLGETVYLATYMCDTNLSSHNTTKGLLNLENSKGLFESRFECGNLFAAFESGPYQYDLILQNDINTKGNTQWFFFGLNSVPQNTVVHFRILNLYKSYSLFARGLLPACFSTLSGMGWVREGSNVRYRRGFIKRSPKSCYYMLSFSYHVRHENDRILFAHSYPYTFTRLQSLINELVASSEDEAHLARRLLARTLGQNNCEVLTITSKNMKLRQQRRGVVVMARQHPGESQSSFIMEGFLRFITSAHPEAVYLRQTCVFKVVPMVNPDGVVHGNYRTSLCGQDLNRRWKKPTKRLHPELSATRQMITQFANERQMLLCADLHGHSKKMCSFFYGCHSKDMVQSRVFPMLMSRITRHVNYHQCTFSSFTRLRENTARVQLWRELKIPSVFTLESSFFGVPVQKGLDHFTIQDYMQMGKDLCIGLYHLLYEEFGALDFLPKPRKLQPLFNDVQRELNSQRQRNELQDTQEDSGSDSNPSDDELPSELIGNFLPRSKVPKRTRIEQIKSVTKIRRLQNSPKLNLQEPSKPIPTKPKPSEPSPTIHPGYKLMVDKCVQTDPYIYQNWLQQESQKYQNPQAMQLLVSQNGRGQLRLNIVGFQNSKEQHSLTNRSRAQKQALLCVTGGNVARQMNSLHNSSRKETSTQNSKKKLDISDRMIQQVSRKPSDSATPRESLRKQNTHRYDTSLEERMGYYSVTKQNHQLPKLQTANTENLYYLPHFQSKKSPVHQSKNLSFFQ